MPRLFLKGATVVTALFLCTAAHAQTIIDLKPGGGVRSKTIDDYREEMGRKARDEADSLAYIDHITRAFNALHEDSLNKAERLFLQALKTRPEAPGNFVVEKNLGRICLVQSRYAEGIEHFTHVLTSRPDMAEIRYDRAVCYYNLNSLKAAADDCTAVLAAHPAKELETRTLFLQSAIHAKSGQPDREREDIENILRSDPQNVGANLLLADCLERLGQPQAAMNHLNLFLSAHPDNVDGLSARSELALKMNQPEVAREDYDEAIRLQPGNAALRVARARVWLRIGNKAAARKDLDSAVAMGVARGEVAALYKEAAK